VAGASGVLGARFVPLLVGRGHSVTGMTRSPHRLDTLTALGAQPVLCDVYDEERLRRVLRESRSEVLVDFLTDLPDLARAVPEFAARTARMWQEGTANLVAAARAARVGRLISQSLAWNVPGEVGRATHDHEKMILDANGTLLRFGQLFGPGTYYESKQPPPPRIHIDSAVSRAYGVLGAPPGIVTLIDE
jgi:nucleoside-diphosphate-sugar epimerase